jgi:hypothetical protein
MNLKNGAGDRDRTGDLLFTKQLLYQLSYPSTETSSDVPAERMPSHTSLALWHRLNKRRQSLLIGMSIVNRE